MDKEFKLALDKAKIGILENLNSTFISTILFNLKLVVTDALPTAGVDGTNLFINPKFFLAQSPRVRISVLFHEAWHVAWNHPARGQDLDPELYNIAGDYIINIMGQDANYEIPKTWYCKTKYRGWGTKQVYDDLLRDPPPKPNKPCNGGPGGPLGNDITYLPANMSDEDKTKREVEWVNIVHKAAVASKIAKDAPGTIPGEIEVILEEILNPKLPWNVLLQNYMTSYAKDDYSYRRPNRRFFPHFYLPSAFSVAVGHIAVAVDTSGSVTDEEFAEFRNEIQGIKSQLQPEKLTVISFDTKIKKIVHLDQEDDFKDVQFSGRGGTNLTEVWNWTIKHQPICMIIFSDMECGAPTKDSGTDVLWVCVDNPKIKMPFGTTIHLPR